MKKVQVILFALIAACGLSYAAQTLNNPIGADGCYIVKWDCVNNRFASSNDFEVDETFTFAVDLTGTQWVEWLAANSARRVATNFGLTGTGNGIARDGDRLFHITGNIWGKTINIAQLATASVNKTIGQQQAVYSNLFGFDIDGGWWMEPSDDIVGNSDCFFRTAAYTGKHTCPNFTTNDYEGNPYSWINQPGYAVPCVVSEPCYSENQGGNNPGGDPTPIYPQDPPLEGSQVYTFDADKYQRGYYNRPYERYEAEPGFCTTNGQFLAASDNQHDLQSEASHQQAVQLTQVGDYVQWVVNKAGDGLTVRFSLPDSDNGQGTDGNLDIYAGTDKVGSLYLNSYWAWQYCDGTYPDNTPRSGNVVIRMRFDENHVRLSRKVEEGEVLKLVKTDKGGTPYTIDFAELEPVPAKVTFESLSGNKVQYDGNGDVGQFIMDNQGKTIYLPEGTWTSDRRIYLRNADGTKVIGAGMWYTQIWFSASSDNAGTYSYRGFEVDNSNIVVEGLYLNTSNNKRYYNNNSSNQVGKGFMGCWGNNSIIRNCWVEHFECGAWISNYSGKSSSNLLIEHCRFRNNYADGTNCSHNVHGANIRYCSYRNNGDDDMASWTTAMMCSNITYSYCTAENNWRASSMGFFGGKDLTAHHLYIVDGLESGARVNADFNGAGFPTDGHVNLHDITIEHCGCPSGAKGQAGDFWGSFQPALSIGAGNNHDINNVTLENINVLNSRTIAVNVRAGNKKVNNTRLIKINVDGATTAFQCSNANNVINTTYCQLTSKNVTNHMIGCSKWEQMTDCITSVVDNAQCPEPVIKKKLINNQLVICVEGQCYDARGMKIESITE